MQDELSYPEAKAGKAYGADFAQRFWLDSQKSYVSRTLATGVLAVTQIRSPFPTPEPSASIPYDEAHLVALMVENCPDHELWQDGRAAKTPPFRGGSTVLFDLRRDPVSFTRNAHHSLHFYIPNSVFTDLAERTGTAFDGELRFSFANPYDDPVVRHLGRAALALLDQDGSPFALDCLMQSLAAHTLQQYGGGKSSLPPSARGLPRKLLRLAQEVMEERLAGDLTVTELADLCGLSPSHFSRAFKQAPGFSPHRWMQIRRIERAKALLVEKTASLAEIALTCGFADQSHFTRTFSREVGESPMRWLNNS